MKYPVSANKHTRRWPRRVLIALCVAALGTGGWLAASTLRGNGDPAANYQLTAVQRGDIEDVVTATGTLQPREYVDVGAQVSGQLQKIHVKVGSQVQEGNLLAEIDSTVYLSRVDASRAQLRNQRAQLKEREAQLALARIQFQRQTALMAENATAEESLQTAEASLKSAEASLEALRAQIEQTESSLRGDEANLQYARVLSPMAGTVVSIGARQGQTLNTNQQAPIILRIADLSVMTVRTQVSEADVGRLRTGMQAYFTTLGGQNKRWYGTLDQIEPTPTTTNNVVLYNALFDVPNPDARLMTDMTAQVFFVVAQAKDALQIPMGALQQNRVPRAGNRNDEQAAAEPRRPKPPSGDGDGSPRTRHATVKVLEANGKIAERAIEIGVTNRIVAQVMSGLAEGDKVVSGLTGPEAQQGGGGNSGAPRRMMGGPRL
ncbi:MAG: efflux RND transporter periplasmic adaptor subunit [Azoarcus sp.]|jgi:macrolide-specific efflux system membrane fusion protein|nr:efflux RND transporter periplasmic adaptor subunit [Azoarcus sp.]